MKKVISLILVFVMLMGSIVTVSAAQQQEEIADSSAEEIVEHVVRGMVGAGEDTEIQFNQNLNEMLDENSNSRISIEEITAFFSEYIMIDVSSLNGIAEEIAQNSEYQVAVLKDGTTVVYVFVDILNYPQLFIPSVFAQAVRLIHEAQEKIGLDADPNYNGMSYNYMAGELFLHEVIFGITTVLGGFFEWSPLHEYYLGAAEACLNIDEDRLPAWMFEIVGIFTTLVTQLENFFK